METLSHLGEHRCVEIDVEENLIQQYLKGKSPGIKIRKGKFIAIHIIPKIIIATMKKVQISTSYGTHTTHSILNSPSLNSPGTFQ